MTVVRSAIFAEIARRLGEIVGVKEVERMPSGDPISFPALHIFDDGHSVLEGEANATRYAIAPEIVGYIEAESGAEAHDQISELYASTVAALLSEPPLGGLVETIDEGSMRIVVAPLAKGGRLAFTLELPITFPTRRGDPAQAA